VKKAAALALALVASTPLAQGYPEAEPRRLELVPFAGLFWTTQVETSQGYIETAVAADLGLALDLRLGPDSQLEVGYAYAGSRSRFVSQFLATPSSGWFDVAFHHLQVGGTTLFPRGDLEPFLSGSVGLLWIAPSDPVLADGRTVDLSGSLLFAFSVGGGLKWYLSRGVGLRVQARFLFPVLFSAGALYSGPGGATFTVNGGIPMVQGDLGVGLVIAP
jgi:hypothetical protein